MSNCHDGTPSKSAIYAQQRRDNETEVRNELKERLQSYDLVMSEELAQRGDMNMTTKVLVVALQSLDPDAEIPKVVERKSHAVTSAEYNAARRQNEALVRESLRNCLPVHISSQDFMERSDLNPTSKIIVATTKLLDESLEPMVSKSKRSETASLSSSPWSSDSQDSVTGMPKTKSRRIRWVVPDSDDGNEYALDEAMLETPPEIDAQRGASSSSTPFQTPSPVNSTIIVSLDTPSSADTLESPYLGTTSILSDHQYDVCPPRVANPRPRPGKSPARRASSPINSSHPLAQPHAWELQPIEAHTVPEIRQIEQAAKRLVAKTKELIEPVDESVKDRVSGYRAHPEQLSAADEADLAWISDLLIDAISIVEGPATRRKVKQIQQKWDRTRRVWRNEGLLFE